MRIYINLASQPYEDARAFYSRWLPATALTLLVTVLLATDAGLHWHKNRSAQRDLRAAEQQCDKLESQMKEGQAILASSANRDTRDHLVFLNGMLAEKSLSWTRIFSDLEQIMPRNVHVQSIQPELKRNQFALDIVVIGRSHDDALALVKQLEKSDHFPHPEIRTIDYGGGHGDVRAAGQGVIFRIHTGYLHGAEGV